MNRHVYSTSFDLAELLVYNADLLPYERQEVEGYLAWKWGLNYSQLYPGHPYKFITPLNN